MNANHKKILALITSKSTGYSENGLPYVGTKRPFHHVKVPILRKIIKTFLKERPHLTHSEFRALLDSLYEGTSFTERIIPGYLLQYGDSYRQKIKLSDLKRWLGQLEGWCEIDTTCQSSFTAEDMLAKWPAWENFLTSLSKSKNVAKRRASLVLLNKVVIKSSDKRLANIAFKNIDTLKHERDILITKAISWILRSLTANHKSRVVAYLKKNHDVLPKIAVRETQKKLETGKKT